MVIWATKDNARRPATWHKTVAWHCQRLTPKAPAICVPAAPSQGSRLRCACRQHAAAAACKRGGFRGSKRHHLLLPTRAVGTAGGCSQPKCLTSHLTSPGTLPLGAHKTVAWHCQRLTPKAPAICVPAAPSCLALPEAHSQGSANLCLHSFQAGARVLVPGHESRGRDGRGRDANARP